MLQYEHPWAIRVPRDIARDYLRAIEAVAQITLTERSSMRTRGCDS